MAEEEARAEATEARVQRPPSSRTPLIIGGLAIGSIAWMCIVVLLLVAWKLFS